MAMTVSGLKKRRIGSMYVVTGYAALDNHYDLGGYSGSTLINPGFQLVPEMAVLGEAGGYVLKYSKAAGTVKAYWGDWDSAGDGVLVEVAHTTDLSAVTNVPFIAIGR